MERTLIQYAEKIKTDEGKKYYEDLKRELAETNEQ
jgi:hypothetical protein